MRLSERGILDTPSQPIALPRQISQSKQHSQPFRSHTIHKCRSLELADLVHPQQPLINLACFGFLITPPALTSRRDSPRTPPHFPAAKQKQQKHSPLLNVYATLSSSSPSSSISARPASHPLPAQLSCPYPLCYPPSLPTPPPGASPLSSPNGSTAKPGPQPRSTTTQATKPALANTYVLNCPTTLHARSI
ncbi:hypothetical protein PtA15_16A365 [Puccinia triticina]|uniref:Uncharacterized protein n=1 Tax=Puccinia triticina TaxID=208348 RepID=A0ABY7DBY0_9BASI|nr:uncharacterized protein PtA15_16A365 [Puccinia triticina]WAQ92457.1 hypothetical protein PtA15_16A365 [Puccinia triticina]